MNNIQVRFEGFLPEVFELHNSVDVNAQGFVPGVFDVFLCHNSEDKPAVREIAKRLVKEGIKPWLDEEQIRPGTTWQTALGKQINCTKSAAVFVGESGIGPWQNEEIQAFLNEFMERGLPVIPTILASVSGTPELPWTLKNRHRVDFRVSDPDPIKQLIWGITGEEPAPRESLIPGKDELSEPWRRYLESRLYPPLAETPDQKNRPQLEILRRRVIEYWVDGVLRHSLYKEVLISLGKRQVDDFVDAPWKYTVELSDAIAPALLPDRTVSAIYDATGLLLILGEPGSGKTTSLLDLARTLLERAGKDTRERVAIVLNLSSWKKGQPLAEWISVELSQKYRVPRKIARRWLQQDYLLALLDGLDEVETRMQPDCVGAINSFIEGANPSGLVICCRLNEYRWLPERLKLNGAICLERLSEGEVDEYLGRSGPELETLREAVNTDPVLKELTETPLMLNVMSLAFQGASLSELVSWKGNSPEERRKQIFSLYVEQMFRRKGTASLGFPKEKMVGWLSWLAGKMRKNSLSVFLVEGLQPSWLRTRAQRVAYATVVGSSLALILVLFAWPIGGMSLAMSDAMFEGISAVTGGDLEDWLWVVLDDALKVGMHEGLILGLSVPVGVALGCWSQSSSKNGIISGSIAGLIVGLIGGLQMGLSEGLKDGLIAGLIAGPVAGLGVGPLNHITLVETISWKWNQFWKRTIPGSIVGLIGGLSLGLIDGLFSGLSLGGLGYGLIELGDLKKGLIDAPILGLVGGLVSGFIGGLSDTVKVDRAYPNQGIKLSGKASFAVFLVILLAVGLIGGLVGCLIGIAELIVEGPYAGLIGGIITGLIIGLFFGLIGGLSRGGFSCDRALCFTTDSLAEGLYALQIY